MRSAFLRCKAAVLVTCVVGYFFSKPGGRRKSLGLFSGFKFKFSDDQLGERSVINIEFKMIAVLLQWESCLSTAGKSMRN